MSTKQELEHLSKQLAWQLRQAEIAATAAEEIETEYQATLAEFVTQHPDLVKRRVAAQERAEKAKALVAATRDEAKEEMRVYWNCEDDPEPAEGFKLRRKKVASYIPRDLLKAAIQHAPFLLKIDESAVQKFVINNAVEVNSKLKLPDIMAAFIPLNPAYENEPTISDKTLLKHAPTEDPGEYREPVAVDDLTAIPV